MTYSGGIDVEPEAICEGDWITTRPFGHQGTAENVDRHILTVRLDPDHGHFRDTVLSSLDEVSLVRDAAVEEAEQAIARAQNSIQALQASIRFHEGQKRKAQAELKQARADLREARRIPRRRPKDTP